MEVVVFPAESKKEAYIEALELVDSYDDIYFDGLGDKTVSKGIGIHNLELVNFTESTFAKKILEEGGVYFSLTSSYDMKESKGFKPKTREKKELSIFKDS